MTASGGEEGAGWRERAVRLVGRPSRPADGGDRRTATSLPRELVLFLVIALLGLVVVGTVSAVLSSKIAQDTARQEARAVAQRLATFVVAPLVADIDVPARREALDTLIRSRMEDGSLLTAIVWDRDGRVVYSSDPDREIRGSAPTPELERAFAGEVVSVLDDAPETPLPPQRGPVLEVYTPFTVEGQDVVFEAYFDGSTVDEDTALLRRRLLPLTIGSLVALQALQIPLAVSLGRRLTRQETERRQLVQDHLEASERERREIAAGLHDGPVQDLAGVSYALSAMRPRLPEDQHRRADRMVDAVRDAVASLRRLMVDIYPPELSAAGLVPALEDLAEPLRERGLAVLVTAGDVPAMPQETAAVLWRSTKEALANVVRHAGASSVWIDVGGVSAGGPAVRLTVADDGRGLGGADGSARASLPVSGDGHLGLRLVRDRVQEAGGTLALQPRPGGGTVLAVEVPVPEPSLRE